MILVNIFGVPGAGKSTGAAYVFAMLKSHGVNAELVTEFAKDKVWEESKAVFNNQAYIFGKQYFRISRCQDKVDVVVTDSPLLLCILYNHNNLLGENFNNMVSDVFNSYTSQNYLLQRVKKYNPSGRFQSEEESNELYKPMVDLLNGYNVPYVAVNGDFEGYDAIVKNVLTAVNKP